jgi:hypothetical protein
VKRIIHREFDEKDVALTDDKKLVAFYVLRDVQPLYLMTGRNERLLYAFSKAETEEYFKLWKDLKPVKDM